MSALAKDEYPQQNAHQQDPGHGEVHGERRPLRDHIFRQGVDHRSSLADPVRSVATATVGHSLFESETTMLYAKVSLTPSTTALPGGAALQQIANGIASWALIGALVALLLGAALWAVGSHTQNMHQSAQGRRAVLTSLGAAILIGAAPSLINFFFNTGLTVH